jgi:hypothetical protein
MASYGGLHELGQSIAGYLRAQGGNLSQTHYGQPLEDPISTTESVRVTLLWLTPQPTHLNDAAYRNALGRLEPAPLTISAYFMITTYGGDADPATAYELLGRVLRAFHEMPELTLPIDGVGQGKLSMALVPMAADLMEKVFMPLQIKHRPFVLYEASPVQLIPEVQPTTGAPPVKPGGIGLDVTVLPKPVISRVTPEQQLPGAAVRVDVSIAPGAIATLTIGGTVVAATPIPDAQAVRAIVPATVAGDVVPVAVKASATPGLWSSPYELGLLQTSAPSLQAPAVGQTSAASPLTLDGTGLATATSAFFWPDDGAPGSGDIRELTLAGVTATSVTIGALELTSKLGASPGHRSLMGLQLRCVVRLGSGLFTPCILMRFVP